jgi:trans-aconitate methyltransferase
MDHRDWDARYREKGGLLWTAEPNRFVVQVVEGLTPGTVYDLAGGHARNAVWLAERGWDCTMVDWSEIGVQQGRDLAASRGVTVHFEQADLLTWRPPAQKDLVLVVYLQLPSDERRAVWRTAASAVAPGGTLAVIGHDSSNLTEGFGGPRHPAVLYTADEVAATVGAALSVTRAERVERPVEMEDGMHVALDNVVVAVRP